MRDLDTRHVGAGWPEWMLSLACSLLAGNAWFEFQSMSRGQTAEQYYSQVPGVALAQGLGFGLDLATLAACLVWVVAPFTRKYFAGVLAAIAVAAVLTIWWELSLALGTFSQNRFRLEQLPVRPVNNLGLVGASFFLAYLIAKAPEGNMTKRLAIASKSAIWGAATVLQWAAWDLMFQRYAHA